MTKYQYKHCLSNRRERLVYLVVMSVLFLMLLFCSSLVLAQESTAGQVDANTSKMDESKLADMMDEARDAMFENEYNRAIKVYSELAELPDHVYRRDALESLGLAHERVGDFDQAIIVYEHYLQLYPEQEDEDSDRVRQRLAGVITATWKKRKEAPQPKKAESNWRTYGTLFQHVRRYASSSDLSPSKVGHYALSTSLDLNSRGKEGAYDIKTRVSGYHVYDLDDSPVHQQRLNYLYVDVNQRDLNVFGRFGRQRANGGGVLGRFDGLSLGARINPQYVVNVVAGMPVASTADISTNDLRKFYGVNFETGPFNEAWLINGYYIQQVSEGYTDREAIGGEIRYMRDAFSIYNVIDYDIHFNKLNILSSQLTWAADEKTNYNLLLDYRNAPPLTTRSALLGQSVQSLVELEDTYTEEEIHQLAIDRTPQYYMVAGGFSYRMSPQYQWDADITASKLEDTPASGGVAASDGTPAEYYYSTRFTAYDYFTKGDANILSLRIADMSTGRNTTLSANTRMPVGEHWRVNPRLSLGLRNPITTGFEETSSGFGFKVDYRLGKSLTFEFDCASTWTTKESLLGNQHFKNYYANLGYRLVF